MMERNEAEELIQSLARSAAQQIRMHDDLRVLTDQSQDLFPRLDRTRASIHATCDRIDAHCARLEQMVAQQ